jgi:cyclic beta-1,2-glucan synthetase
VAPPSGRGVRTRIADHPIWLPYAVTHYLEVTGDATLLDEIIPFLEGPPIASGNDDSYFQPSRSTELGTLFEHPCARPQPLRRRSRPSFARALSRRARRTRAG